MAQSEDTELRDLVMEALERNGSLAKIRALLRANVFLAFEEDYENIKQNVSLDNILKLPEGKLSLSIVHEFLEYCNLKNTLFVYMAESRQKKDYSYEGSRKLAEKLNLPKLENVKEPILVSLVRHFVSLKKYSDHTDNHNLKVGDHNFNKDDQNCTYIVHEDSSSTASSNSQSDNSSDEKNKLHLRLQLDNSDTDTSCDSAKDKSSSVYIPNQHIVFKPDSPEKPKGSPHLEKENTHVEQQSNTVRNGTQNLHELKLPNNSSSESTSYIDLKPFFPSSIILQTTQGVPVKNTDVTDNKHKNYTAKLISNSADSQNHSSDTKIDSASSVTLGSVSITSPNNKKDLKNLNDVKSPLEVSARSDAETAGYSYDFTASTVTKNDEENRLPSAESLEEEVNVKSSDKNTSIESPHQNSQSSRSSVSISDVTDLISENSSLINEMNNAINMNKTGVVNSNNKSSNDRNKLSDDSAEYSESPIPSLSNLSLDIHSD